MLFLPSSKIPNKRESFINIMFQNEVGEKKEASAKISYATPKKTNTLE